MAQIRIEFPASIDMSRFVLEVFQTNGVTLPIHLLIFVLIQSLQSSLYFISFLTFEISYKRNPPGDRPLGIVNAGTVYALIG